MMVAALIVRSCLIVSLVFLLAPCKARAEEAAQPLPVAGNCSIEADDYWTPQEVFVWREICIGKVAHLRSPDGVLSSRFLETVLLKDKYRHALTRNGVQIVGARFTDPVDLSDAELGHALELINSVLEKGGNFSGLRSSHLIALDGSKVLEGALDLSGLRAEDLSMSETELGDVNLGSVEISRQLRLDKSTISGKLDMNNLRVGHVFMNDAKFGDVNLQKAHVMGNLTLSGSKVTENLDMRGVEIDYNLVMSGHAEFARVNLSSARVGRQIDLNTSKVAGLLDMNGIQVGQDLFMNEGARFTSINLTGALVKEQLGLRGSTVNDRLYLNAIHVEHLFMNKGSQFEDIDLKSARIEGQLNMTGSKVRGKLDMGHVQVGEDLLMDGGEFSEVDLVGAHVSGRFDLRNSRINDRFNGYRIDVTDTIFLGRDSSFARTVELIYAHAGKNIELAGGNFLNNVDLTGAHIDGELRLGSSRHQSPRWGPDRTLILRNATANAIQDLSDAWPSHLDLNGFTYHRLGGLNAMEKDPMSERSLEWFEDWLKRQKQYTAQPYEQLALVLQGQGETEKAKDIRYDSWAYDNRAGYTRNAFMWLSGAFIGYGYKPWRALYWALGLTLLGAVILRLFGEGPKNNMPFGLSYSFDMLLPIIRLREKHYTDVDLPPGFTRYYFYGHKIMGYVLASFVIAALAGLMK
jgi:hypothetical protein